MDLLAAIDSASRHLVDKGSLDAESVTYANALYLGVFQEYLYDLAGRVGHTS